MSKQRAAALVDAGVFLQLAGDLAGARDLFRQALTLDPESVKAQRLLVSVGGTLPTPPTPPQKPESSNHHMIPADPQRGVETLPPRLRSTPPSPSPTRTFAPKPRKQEDAEKELAEVDVFVRYGMYDKALDYVMRVLRRDPDDLGAHEKAYEILRASGHRPAALEQLLNVLRLLVKRGDAARARPYLEALRQERPGHPELKRFVSLLADPSDTLPPSLENPVPARVGDTTLLDEGATSLIDPDLTSPPKRRR